MGALLEHVFAETLHILDSLGDIVEAIRDRFDVCSGFSRRLSDAFEGLSRSRIVGGALPLRWCYDIATALVRRVLVSYSKANIE